MILGS